MSKPIEIYYVKIRQGNRKAFWVEVTKEQADVCWGKVLDPSIKEFGKIIPFSTDSVIKFHVARLSGLGSPYIPASESCTILDTIVPESMNYETHIAIRKIKEAVGGNLSEYVSGKLQYTQQQLCKALAAEQIDAVAMAIYNIEIRNQGMIVGDQTGIGKGRVAAAMIRYGYFAGRKPVFMSEKPNLFSDIYRDLVDIGSGDLVPFIINSQDSKTNVKDKEGNIVFQSLIPHEHAKVIASGKIPKNFDYALCTYSQFNKEDMTAKKAFLLSIAKDNILIMDEAHNASGSSNTGQFLQEVIGDCRGVLFLSGTFAKRPDNMPIYAMKTSMKDANMDSDQLVEAIEQGGVALQEVLASQLVLEGQMLRRERTFDGVEVNFITLDDLKEEHRAICDNITEATRDMIAFQSEYVNPEIQAMNKIAAAEGQEIRERGGTSEAGIRNSPYFSKIFNIFNQMLFSIKADAVADRAIMRLKEGKKPVIAFASTMGSFLSDMKSEGGSFVANGDLINADFNTVLQKGLDGLLRYTAIDHAGKKEYKELDISAFSPEAQAAYYAIVDKVKKGSTGVCISPIDRIIQKIEAAGYSVSEVTGRSLMVQFDQAKMDKAAEKIAGKKAVEAAKASLQPTNGLGRINASNIGMVLTRQKENVNDAFRRFNNNEVDVLLINQSGSTGASAHAVVTPKVKLQDVKQRCMIILQPELNISTEVQKRGRINRTGQVFLPIYDYVSSAIPAEKRLVMMLQSKLKSLDANTTSNQNQSEQVLNVDDFLNKYGDKVVHGYLLEHLDINEILNDPLGLGTDNLGGKNIPEDIAYKTSGRIAVLPCQEQEAFFTAILDGYKSLVEYLKQTGEYNLEVQTMNLEAETIEAKVCVAGTGGNSIFGQDSIDEKCMVNVLRKPYSLIELKNILTDSLQGMTPEQCKEKLCREYKRFVTERLANDVADLHTSYELKKSRIHQESGYKKVEDDREARAEYVAKRTDELDTARDESIKREKESSENRFNTMNANFEYFNIGGSYLYPILQHLGSEMTVPAIFLGYQIDYFTRSNPYAPSAVKLRFALSDSHKYIPLVCSGEQGLQIRAIIGSTFNRVKSDFLLQWDELTKKNSVNRKARHIITGNLLQASAIYMGNLISYTCIDGSAKKGILMPDNWENGNKRGETQVVLPISKAKKVITELIPGDSIETMNGLVFHRDPYGRRLIELSVPKTKAFQAYFKDVDIINLCTNPSDGFEMRSGRMLAWFEQENLQGLIDILQQKFSVSMRVNPEQFDLTVDLDHQTMMVKSPQTARAEQQYLKDKHDFEVRQFHAEQAKEAAMTKKCPPSDDALAKAKAKAKARLFLLSAQF